MKTWVRRAFERAGYVVFNTRSHGLYAHDGLFTFNNSHFIQDSRFQAAYQRGVLASRGVDPKLEWRLHVALWAAQCCARIPGDFVECGVNSGFMSSSIMHYLDWRTIPKLFALIDTFSGPVLSQYSAEEVQQGRRQIAEDALRRGAYVTDLTGVFENYAEWPNVRVIQGEVPGVLEQLDMSRIAFLHLDMNCAYPEAQALAYLWPRLSPGGMVLLDDYSRYGFNSIAAAIDAAAKERSIQVLSLPTGQGLIMNTPL